MEITSYNQKLKQRSRDLRINSTLPEVILWNKLKRKGIGYQFLRQKPIQNYIVDFYCKELKLAIEIDGSSHDLKIEEDVFRQKQLESLSIVFLRFSNEQIKNDIDGVLEQIMKKIKTIKNIPPARGLAVLPSRGDFPSYRFL